MRGKQKLGKRATHCMLLNMYRLLVTECISRRLQETFFDRDPDTDGPDLFLPRELRYSSCPGTNDLGILLYHSFLALQWTVLANQMNPTNAKELRDFPVMAAS